jgi:molybdopterin-guanine dinucleotide biosynthesis protein A
MLDDRTNNELGNMSDLRMTLSAVLLAGGESRRMGRDKAAIEFEGQPMWKRQLAVLRGVASGTIFVSARTKPSWLPEDAVLILDDLPSRGPLSGLTKTLAAMRTTHLIALAVDMPFITSERLAILAKFASEGRGVVPVIGERTEPLAAIYPAAAELDFAVALAGTDFSLQRVIRKLAAEKKVTLFAVPAQDEHFYRSVNEPSSVKEGRFSNRPPN